MPFGDGIDMAGLERLRREMYYGLAIVCVCVCVCVCEVLQMHKVSMECLC
jgi:hypothetical protein